MNTHLDMLQGKLLCSSTVVLTPRVSKLAWSSSGRGHQEVTFNCTCTGERGTLIPHSAKSVLSVKWRHLQYQRDAEACNIRYKSLKKKMKSWTITYTREKNYTDRETIFYKNIWSEINNCLAVRNCPQIFLMYILNNQISTKNPSKDQGRLHQL
jgi:hypothetical protein